MIVKKICLGIVLVASLASCKKILETSPSHVLDGSTRFETIEDYDFALTGAYRLFRQGSYLGAGSSAYSVLPDMLSDNLNETSESLGNQTTLTTWTYAEDEPNIAATWQAAYSIVQQANLSMNDIDRFATTSQGAVNRIKGQALAIRGMVHFDVLRYWAEDFARNSTKLGVPYVKSLDYNEKPARLSVKESYDNIEADLKHALNHLGSVDATINGTARAYIDHHVVHAMLARIYLYAQEYDSAIKYSTRVINAFPLASRANFPLIWQDASTSEVIWNVIFNAGEGRVGDNVYFVPNNRSSYRPNQTLVATYDQTNDVRFTSYFQTRSGRRVLSKYLAKQAAQTKPDGVVNFKIFRTGEMYLIRAESYARKGGANEVTALADLNTLRAARIAGFVAGVETGAALLNAIALERRKELIGEGHRWFDLKRTTRTINRDNCTVFCTLASTHRAWAWPIPISELNANPNIQQNPGY